MGNRLLASTADLAEIIRFAVPGIHFEKIGASNQPWDRAVAQAVDEAWARMGDHSAGGFEW